MSGSESTLQPSPQRIFQSMAAAEEAYRQEQQRNEALGNKLDRIAELLERLVVQTSTPSPPPATSPETKNEPDVTPAPIDEEPSRSISPTSGLRVLNLPRSRSDPSNTSPTSRREYLQRDRSRPPPSSSPSRLPTTPAHEDDGSFYKAVSGTKLPFFRGRYIDNVNAWITIIEDRFWLIKTPERAKIATVSALFKGDALIWYLDIRSQYVKQPTWEEFKRELRVKFADSPIRTSYLRKKLRSIPYEGPFEMEQYISEFRSIEIQIIKEDMTFGDKLEYFLQPFSKDLQRHVKNERPMRMEVAYDAALDWATVYMDTTDYDPTKTKASSEAPVNISLSVPKPSLQKRLPVASAKSEEDELDMLANMEMSQVTCHRCLKPGHFARNCLAKQPAHSSSIGAYSAPDQVDNRTPVGKWKPVKLNTVETMFGLVEDYDRSDTSSVAESLSDVISEDELESKLDEVFANNPNWKRKGYR
jgi:hypothetical protein